LRSVACFLSSPYAGADRRRAVRYVAPRRFMSRARCAWQPARQRGDARAPKVARGHTRARSERMRARSRCMHARLSGSRASARYVLCAEECRETVQARYALRYVSAERCECECTRRAAQQPSLHCCHTLSSVMQDIYKTAPFSPHTYAYPRLCLP